MHRSIPVFLLTLIACGGGGAAVEPAPADPQNPSAPPVSTPSPAPPAGAIVVTTAGTSFNPASITIAPGATVVWQVSGATHNVTFGPAKPDGGDVPDTRSGSSASRTFTASGTYDYQCTRHSGMTGRVIVSGDAAAPNPSAPGVSETVVQSTPAAYSPERVEISAGTAVTWEFAAGSGGIVFDDEAPAGGNIPAPAAGARVSRTFSAAGDYDYHSSTNRDVKGRVRVR